MAAIIGGGSGFIRPGAISRAHRGVLFLDEAPEFKQRCSQALRQPAESGEVTIARASGVVRYPARFQLVLAANPCPCGRGSGKGADCSCSPTGAPRYMGRLSGPLLDRVDLQVQVHAGHPGRAGASPPGSRARWWPHGCCGHARSQAERLAGTPWQVNAEVPGPMLRRSAFRLPREATADLDRAIERGALTLRGYDRVLRAGVDRARPRRRRHPDPVGRGPGAHPAGRAAVAA